MLGALWGLFVVLLVLWLLGFVVFHVTSFLIHILLVLAVIVLIYNVVMHTRARRL
nr:lmo0937 family membrane protein [Ktedonobacteraceae bacterium]